MPLESRPLVPIEPAAGVAEGERAPERRALFSGGNQVELLRAGAELFPAMRAAIEAAEREVWLASYIFNDDASALAVLDALCAAAARGVRLHVVVDGFGSLETLGALQARFAAAGAELAVFRPLRGWWSWVQPSQLRRLHLKLCLVDGTVGFVGGVNLIDDRFDQRHGWSQAPRLDFAVRLHGPVLGGVADALRAVWTRASMGRDWPVELIALARATRPVLQARRLLHDLRIGDTPPLLTLQAQAVDALAPQRAAFVVRDNLRRRRTIERSYVEAIRRAQERIDLVCPYFYPGHVFRRALRDAADRGVRVRLLMQGVWDYRAAALAARAVYGELLAHGVRIYEYTPAFLHAKVAVVDADWATVGSSNIDPLSLLLNLEANVIVRDAEFSAALGREIDAAVAASREVAVADTDGRVNLLRRGFVAWCARVFLRIAGATGRY
jgi:cardiolipin synthase A/B